MLKNILFVATSTAMLFMAQSDSLSHEMWIEPENFQLELDDQLKAQLFVGQQLLGTSQRYLPQDFLRFEIAHEGNLRPVEGRIGDRPAAQVSGLEEGLNVVIFESTILTTSYANLEKFESFAAHKGYPEAAKQHVAAQFPTERFREAYTRHAKSLVAVGSGAGRDQAYGLGTEWIALENPYTDNWRDGLDLQLNLDGQPKPDAQLEIFERNPAGEVTVTINKVDGQGRVTIPVKAGHFYLIDSVELRMASPELAQSKAVLWESLWASLTFEVPTQ